MESDQISTIEDWPTRESKGNVPLLLGFTNIYRRFIQKYAKAAVPMNNLLQTTWGSARWECTRDAELAFSKPKRAFTEAPILQHIDPRKRIILQTDVNDFAIADILNHYDRFGTLRQL